MRPIGKITSEGRAHAALYARVSTHAGQNPEMQLAELRGYCQRRGWEIAGEYVDVGISGAKTVGGYGKAVIVAERNGSCRQSHAWKPHR